ncbi:hypothetical protein SESBI_39401 [Sesbania bispinosa]|nr:hypothetical protein SESBI_39401 [Sesbania bispinosa]
MGCGGSKVEEFPVVTLCRERKQFLKAASEQRYALAAAHVAYFQSLRDIGEALRRFADQDLFIATASPSSPVLTLPSHEGKPKKNKNNNQLSSSSPSISHHDSPSPEGSHLHLSSGSEFSSPSSGHIHIHETSEQDQETEPEVPPTSSYSPPYGYQHYHHPQDWTQPGVNTYAYYMKRSAPQGKSIIYEEPERHVAQTGQWSDSPYGYGYPGTSNTKAVPLQQVSSSDGSSKTESPDAVASSKSSPEEQARKKGVSFEIDHDEATVTTVDGESSVLSSITTLSPHGTRDIKEVVQEIRDEFETASNYGKEVALLLEVCKPPYRSKVAPFRVIFSRILQVVAPSRSAAHPPSKPPIQFSSRTMKLAKSYCGEPGKDSKTNPENLSSTLEKLYAWEKKLYKEVKDEERLRAIYEKQCKRLKALDSRGAESSKIDATEASIKKLLTKINICIRTVETISGRIHKLRDDELQPQLAALINGLIRMWKFMLKCHQKQFQAIMESKAQSLKFNTALQRDEGLKAILELEKELLNWCSQFNNWVKTQKSYVENLNGWLIRCLPDEPEETADGIVPFSPSRIGAPPVFIICNDWHQAMTRISERGVADAMHEFAQKLHELWERQDDVHRQRIRAEYLTKDFEKQLRTLRTEMGGFDHDHDKVSGKTTLSMLSSDSGVSPLDDLKVDLDSMKKRLHEERARHKEAIKLVRDAASNSLQAGLIPIFKTLESFTSEVVKAHEQVRLQNPGDS